MEPAENMAFLKAAEILLLVASASARETLAGSFHSHLHNTVACCSWQLGSRKLVQAFPWAEWGQPEVQIPPWTVH